MKKSTFFTTLVMTFFLTFTATAWSAMWDADFVRLCGKGSAQAVRDALLQGADPNGKSNEAMLFSILEWFSSTKAPPGVVYKYDGLTPLMAAATSNSSEVVSILLNAGAKPNTKGDNGQTALMLAAANNSIEVISLLIKAGADVNAKDKEGNTALLNAASNNSTEVVSALLKAGADTNAKSDNGQNALMLASAYNTPPTVSLLLKAGIEVNAKDKKDHTALTLSAMNNKNPEVIDLLLKAGADIDAKAQNGQTALDFAREKNNTAAVKILEPLSYAKILKVDDPETQYQLALKYTTGKGVERDEKKGLELLLMASRKGHEKAKRSLALLTATDEGFINLCGIGFAQEIQEALNAGANANAKCDGYGGYDGFTPLMIAAAQNTPEVISILLKAGADVNAKTGIGNRLIQYYRTQNNDNFTPLIFAAACNENPKVVSTLLKAGADVNAITFDGYNALMWAVEKNRKREIIYTLLKAGTDINAKSRGDIGFNAKPGMTALMIAALDNEKADIVSLLLKAGADINAKERNGYKTALDYAYEKNNVEVIKVLEAAQRGVSWIPTPEKDFKANGAIVGNKVNVRSRPNTSSKVIKQLNAGHPLNVVKQSGEWFYIQTASGTEGWVFGKYIQH